MPALDDPNVGPAPDLTEAMRDQARALRELWALGDERAGLEAERIERQVEDLDRRDAAAKEVAKKSRAELDAAIEAKRAAEAAKTEPAPAPVPDDTKEAIR